MLRLIGGLCKDPLNLKGIISKGVTLKGITKLSIARMSTSQVSYLNQKDAIQLDQDLFNECQFSVDQLMELAGLSVASVIRHCYPLDQLPNRRVLIACGPGNNGGDGLVAARHLKSFGYDPEVYYPKRGNSELFGRLVAQLDSFAIRIVDDLTSLDHSLIVDALFGFSFKPPVRPQFVEILNRIADAKQSKLISVDIPSGWHVESGPASPDGEQPSVVLMPDCLVSLTAPKLCAKLFTGSHHYLGGRFVPEKIAKRYNLVLPAYPSSDQFVKL